MTDQKSVINWQVFIGFIFLLAGGIFLADQFLEVEIMRNYWPLLVGLLGVMLFIAMILAGKRGAWLAILASVITVSGAILYIHHTYNLWLTWVYAWGLLISAVGLGMLIMNIYLKRDGLRKAAGWVIGIGLILFVIFGILFEIIMGLTDYNVNSGIFLGGGLVLLGIFVVFSGLIFSDKRKKLVKESPTDLTVTIPETVEPVAPEREETAVEVVESEPVESLEIISSLDEAETVEPVETAVEVVESEPVESLEIFSDVDEAETVEPVETAVEVVEFEPVESPEIISDVDEVETVEPMEEISEAVEYEITEAEDMISEEDEPYTKSDDE